MASLRSRIVGRELLRIDGEGDRLEALVFADGTVLRLLWYIGGSHSEVGFDVVSAARTSALPKVRSPHARLAGVGK